jgi:tRNA(fMet)-specific endonuclease VapC
VARRPDIKRLSEVIDQFLIHVSILPWDSAAARKCGKLRATLDAEGRPMGNLDLMIAAHALALSAVPITNDHAFRRIRRLKVEDWTKR